MTAMEIIGTLSRGIAVFLKRKVSKRAPFCKALKLHYVILTVNISSYR